MLAHESSGPVHICIILGMLLIAHCSLTNFLMSCLQVLLPVVVLCTLWPVYIPTAFKPCVSLAMCYW